MTADETKYDVFICYPRTFEAQVSPLTAKLQIALRNVHDRDATVFQDKSGLGAGDDWRNKIDKALDEARVLVVIVTPTLFQSDECRREILAFAKDASKVIIPLILEHTPEILSAHARVDDPEAENEAHRRKVAVLKLLERRNIEDFTEFTYKSSDDPAYLERVARIARAVGARITASEAQGGAPAEASPPKAPDSPPARSGGRKAAPLIAGAAAVAALVGYYVSTMDPPAPPEPAGPDPQVAAREALAALADAAPDGAVWSLDKSTMTLRAPIASSIEVDIALEPSALVALGEAGLSLGFDGPGEAPDDGVVCAEILTEATGDARLVLSASLAQGEVLSTPFKVGLAEDVAAQWCAAPVPSWRPVDAARIRGARAGAFRVAPFPDASAKNSVRLNTLYQGPLSESADAPGWYRVKLGGRFRYTEKENLLVEPD
ncbi:MAG: toll/interleukin-1 receptor domain-containing protein [Pseudomonadota bacterium]